MILAIDPGPEQSAYVKYCPASRRPTNFGKVPNSFLLKVIGSHPGGIVVEMIASYGMPVGREVFETCVWIGRFEQASIAAFGYEPERVYRSAVKMHLCGSMRAKDGNVRQAIIDAFGGKEKAMGTKKQRGPLYGVSGDVWAALGVAVTYADRQEQARAA